MKEYAVWRLIWVFGLAMAFDANAANIVTAPQGGVARWHGLDAKSCGIYGKRYPAVEKRCYYPVDIRSKPGTHQIALWDMKGRQHLGTLVVQKAPFTAVEMTLPDSLSRFLKPSAEDTSRVAKESAAVAKVLSGRADAPAKFTLPLGAPSATLPASEDDFGSLRIFNQQRRSLHSGRDYPVAQGTPVKAVADGKVVLAAEHFYAGNSVFVDHGGGLVSMVFHLASVDVKPGDEVKAGQTLGTVGATGRATGPHLHIGLRWLGKRIDPALLFAPPSALPSVTDSAQKAQGKIDRAERKDPAETDGRYDDES